MQIEAQTGNAASILYISRKYTGSRDYPFLESIDHRRLVRYVTDRLTLLTRSHVCVLYHNKELTEALVAELEGSETSWCLVPRGGLLSALQHFLSLNSSIENVLLFHEAAPFPDCHSATMMLEAHITKGADFTYCSTKTLGLSPLIVCASAATRYRFLEDHRSGGADPLLALHGALRSMDRREPIRTSGPALPRALGVPLSCSLPYECIVNDRLTRDAAQAAARAVPEEDVGPRAAVAFKLYVSQFRWSRAYLPSQLTVAPPDKTRVLISAIGDGFHGSDGALYQLLTALERYSPLLLARVQYSLTEMVKRTSIPVEVADLDLRALSPRSLHFCKTLLQSARIDLVHVDTRLCPPLMIAARQLSIPIVYYARLAIASELPEIAYLADHIIATSNFVRAGLARTTYPEDRVTTVYCGYDLSRFVQVQPQREPERRSWGLCQADTTVAMVGQITESKRQHVLVKAIALLRSGGMNVNAVLAGDLGLGQERYADYLAELVQSSNLTQHVRLLGFRTDIEKVYSAIDFLVLGMPDEAGGGGVAVEAMAMGVPVLAPDAGSSRELIDEGISGFLYEPDNEVDLARAIALAQARSNETMRQSARERAADFDIKRQHKLVEAIYDRILAEHRPA